MKKQIELYKMFLKRTHFEFNEADELFAHLVKLNKFDDEEYSLYFDKQLDLNGLNDEYREWRELTPDKEDDAFINKYNIKDLTESEYLDAILERMKQKYNFDYKVKNVISDEIFDKIEKMKEDDDDFYSDEIEEALENETFTSEKEMLEFFENLVKNA